MKKAFSMAAVLAIAISASAATRISEPFASKYPSWPVMEGKYPSWPLIEAKFPKFPEEAKLLKFPSWPETAFPNVTFPEADLPVVTFPDATFPKADLPVAMSPICSWPSWPQA